jgi:NADPH:quinone reductase-like Zn-dependent oxidoreductase
MIHLRQGQIHASIGAQFPLSQAPQAMRLAESGTVRGKVVLVP